jgi:hypothetical protein
VWLRTQKVVEDLADTITELGRVLVEGMVMVEQWGRASDTYEVVLTGAMLERLRLVQVIPPLAVASRS